MQEMVGIHAMDHIDVMAGIAQRMRQPVEIDCVPAKTVRRIERGQVQEIERTATVSHPLDLRRVVILASHGP